MKESVKSHSLPPLSVPANRSVLNAFNGAGFGAIQIASAVLLAVIILPLFALGVTMAPGDFVKGLAHPAVGPALLLSAQTTALCLAINVIGGTPLAWYLARTQGWPTRVAEVLLQLPLVVPPAVAGVGLLMAFGRQGLLGGFFVRCGINLPFSTYAVLIAQVFVSAPLYVRSATAAFKSIDEDTLRVARTLGGSAGKVLLRVAVPAARPGLFAGCALSWARALGEFGATLMFAGNLAGETQTLPLLVYEAMESDLRVAQSISLVLVGVATVVLVLVNRK